MKTLIRILGGLVLLAVVVVVGAIVFVGYYFDSEKLRELVEPQVAKHTGREARLGELELSLFSGLTVRNFHLKEASGKADFLSCKALILEYDLWSLLERQLRIGRVSLESPVIRVIKDGKGGFNFDDLLARLGGSPEAGEKEPATEGEKVAQAIAFDIREVSLKNGRVEFVNRQTKRKLNLDKINLTARDIALERPVGFDLSLVANGAPISLAGVVNPAAETGKVEIKVAPFDLTALAGWLPQDSGVDLRSGKFSFGATVAMNEKLIASAKGGLKISGLSLASKMAGREFKGLDFGLNFDLSYDTEETAAEVRAFDLDLNGAKLMIAGLASPQKVNLKISAPNQTLDGLKPLLGKEAEALPGGRLEFSSKVSTPDLTKRVDFSGRFKSQGLALKMKGGPPPLDLEMEAAGRYLVAKQQVDLSRLKLFGPGVSLSGKGSVSEKWVNINLAGLKLDLAKIIALAPEKPPVDLAGLVSGGLLIRGNPKKPQTLKLKGKLNLDKVTAKGEILPGPVKVSGGMEILDQNIKSMKLKGSLAKTNFELKGFGRNIVTKPRFRIDFVADEVDLAALMASDKVKVKPQVARPRPPQEPDPVQARVAAKGKIRMKKIHYKLLKMKNFTVDYVFVDNVMTIKPMAAKLWPAGTLGATLRVDMTKKGYLYNGLLSLAGADVGPVFSSLLASDVGQFSGTGFLEAKFSGAGLTWENFKKNLKAKIKTNLTGGSVKDNPQLRQVGEFLGVKGMEDYKFDSLKGEFDVRDGVVNLKSALAQQAIPARMRGTIGLDGMTNLGSELKIDPEKVTNATAKKLLELGPKDEQGRYIVPLKIFGPLTGIRAGLDEKAIAAHAKKKISREIQNRLLEQLQPKKEEGETTQPADPNKPENPEGAEEQPNDPLGKILEDNPLDKLLGEGEKEESPPAE